MEPLTRAVRQRRYRILERLGGGSFGTVYRAEMVGSGNFRKHVVTGGRIGPATVGEFGITSLAVGLQSDALAAYVAQFGGGDAMDLSVLQEDLLDEIEIAYEGASVTGLTMPDLVGLKAARSAGGRARLTLPTAKTRGFLFARLPIGLHELSVTVPAWAARDLGLPDPVVTVTTCNAGIGLRCFGETLGEEGIGAALLGGDRTLTLTGFDLMDIHTNCDDAIGFVTDAALSAHPATRLARLLWELVGGGANALHADRFETWRSGGDVDFSLENGRVVPDGKHLDLDGAIGDAVRFWFNALIE